MKTITYLTLCFLGVFALLQPAAVYSAPKKVERLHGEAPPPEERLSLWYRRPAVQWTEALPIGNGRLGGMIFGGIDSERIQLNEATLWAGGPYDPNNADSATLLPEARRLIFAGKFGEANHLVGSRMMSRPVRQLQYQTLGDLVLQFPETKEVENYRRNLNLDTAIATTSYTASGVRFTRDALASYGDGLIVVRLTADKPGQISFTAALKTPHKATVSTRQRRHARRKGRQRRVAGHRRGVEIRGPRPHHGHGRKDRGRRRHGRGAGRRFSRPADRCGQQLQEIQQYQWQSRGAGLRPPGRGRQAAV